MALLRPIRGAQRLRMLALASPARTTSSALTRPFSTTQTVKGSTGSSESRFDPPTGNLFGVKPGETPEREGWEIPYYLFMYGSLTLAVMMYAFKPDSSIQAWALEEARRRLEIEGILPDPHPEVKLQPPPMPPRKS